MSQGFAKQRRERQRRQPRFNEHRLKTTGLRIQPALAEEPLADRRDRAWALSGEYAAASADWISDLMDADVGGACYFAYSCWTTAPWGTDFAAFAQRLQKACQYATCDVFPDVPRGSLNRLPPTVCVGAILLPAQKPDGVAHVHGFLRVPYMAARLPYSLVRIQSDGEHFLMFAPPIIGRVAHHMRAFAGRAAMSFHVDHDGRDTVDLGGDVERRLDTLSYLLARGPEVRSWDLLAFLPWRVWQRAEKARSKYPQPPPRRYFQKRLERRLREEEHRQKHRGWLKRATLAVARSMAQKDIEA